MSDQVNTGSVVQGGAAGFMSGGIPGAAIGAGGAILGGLLSKTDGGPSYFDSLRPMKRAIQWKVADAKAAGIHPLYAMGSSASVAPVIPGQSNMGSAITDAAATVGQAMTKDPMMAVNMRAINASAARDEAAAAFSLSEITRLAERQNWEQDQTITNPIGKTKKPTTPIFKNDAPYYQRKAAEIQKKIEGMDFQDNRQFDDFKRWLISPFVNE